MKKFTLICLTAILFVACNSGTDQFKAIQGTWKLVSIDGAEMIDCEKNMSFQFTDEEAGEISGVKTKKLSVRQGTPACDFIGDDEYDSEYTFTEGMLFIKSLKLDKKSYSGAFEINDLTTDKLVIKTLGKTLTFQK